MQIASNGSTFNCRIDGGSGPWVMLAHGLATDLAMWDELTEALKRHELYIQKCRDCGDLRYYPRALCTNCLSSRTEWVRCAGKGSQQVEPRAESDLI